jgi:ParB-like chromosome segregation protein Spo0J
MEQIEQLAIETLTPYKNNARVHSKKQIEQIAESIKAFGFNNPVLIDKKNNIIAGHGRVEAAKKLNMQKVPTIKIEHLSEKEKRAYILADNKLALNSRWDSELLREELSWLNIQDVELKNIGFDLKELANINSEISDFYSQKTKDITYEPVDEKPEIKELFNADKVNKLLKNIESAQISSELKEFLKISAYRHALINFDKVAEYYCHATKAEQKLIEENALVIIDYEDAVKDGYVQLSDEINEHYLKRND